MKRNAVEIIAGITILAILTVVAFVVVGNLTSKNSKTKPNTTIKPTTVKPTTKSPTTKKTEPTPQYEYSITYNLDGGENNPDNPIGFNDGDTITLLEPTKLGYDFGGWYTSESYSGQPVSKITIATDYVLYAKFDIHEYAITYYNVDGLNNPNPGTYTINDSVITLSNVDRYSSLFKGWYTTSTFDPESKITEINPTSLKDYELYAEFEIIKSDPIVNVTSKDLTYNTLEQELLNVNVTGGTIYYSLDNENFSEEMPKGTNAGNYQIYYKVIGDEYHFDLLDQNIIVTIKKATYDMSNVEFSDKSVTYNGNAQSITITGTLPLGVSVTYENNEGTNVNTYEAIAKFSGDYDNYNVISDMTATLSITKATYDMSGITFDDAEYTYDGEAHSILISGTLPTDVAVEYENNGKTTVGNYTITAKFTGDSTNYELISNMTATLKINKAVYDMSQVTFDDETVVYDGETHNILISGTLPSGVAVEYENNGKTTVGNYTITAKFTGDSTNYELISDMTATLIISKKAYDMSGVEFNNRTVTYTGSSYSIEITGTLPEGVTVSYENNGKINAGTYTITAKFVGDATNYELIPNKTAILTIEKATYDMSGITFNGDEVIYNGYAYSIAILGTLPTGVTVEYENNDKVNVGTYTVIAKFSGDENNYELISDMTATLIINKATYDMSNVEFNDLTVTYDGTSKSIVISGTLPTGVSVEYTGNGKINFGEYTITAKFSGDYDNYNEIDDLTATLTINKATYDMSSITFDNDTVTYDGTSKSIVISGTLPTGVAVEYENNDKVNVGTYTIIAKFMSNNPNYEEISNMEATLIINKATATYTLPTAKDNLVYNESPQALVNAGSVNAGSLEYSLDGETWSTNIPTATTPNTYNVSYRFVLNDNYETIDGGTINVLIDKATIDMSNIELNNKTVTYDGNTQTIVITGTLNPNVTVNYSGEGTNVGTYQVTTTFTVDTTLYYEIDDLEATLTITPATIKNVSVTGYTAILDHNAHNIVVSKSATTVDNSDTTWVYSIDQENWLDEITVTNPEDSGTYYFKISAANHNDYIGHFDVVVTEKNVTTIEITNLSSLNKVYDGTRITSPIIYTNNGLGAVTITYSLDGTTFTDDMPINAGHYTIKVEVSETDTYAKASIQKTFDISKATYDMSGVIFEGFTTVYDGGSFSVVVYGTLPAGVTVTYEGNDQTNVGTYTVVAKFSGDYENYNEIDDMTTTFEIIKATYNMSGVEFNDDTVTYDGNVHSLAISGTLPSGVTVSYENNDKANAGTYEVTAKFSGDYDNYNEIDDMTAELKIMKATYDMSGVTFNDSTIPYDGLSHKLTISGTLPIGVSVTFSDTTSYTEVGEYEYTASFSGDEANYELIDSMTATLTIEKATIDTSSVVFDDLTVTYDGVAKSITATNIPDHISVEYSGNGKTNAGTYTVTVTFIYDEDCYTVTQASKTAILTINKKEIDTSDVIFNDLTVTYDKTNKSILATNIPSGVTVEYTGNGQKNAGVYTVTATFVYDTTNYTVSVASKSATLTINKATINMSEVTFENKTFTYDGNIKSIAVSDNLPIEITKVNYTNNNQVNAGIYTVIASFEYDTDNYNEVSNMSATLTINKKEIDNSNIELPDATYTYDGSVKSLAYTGVLPSEILGVNYTGNNQTNAGEYDVILTFNYDTTNYTVRVLQLYGTLTIEKATIDTSVVVFNNLTVDYDGTSKSITATNLPTGITANYTNNGKINAGTYTVTATFVYDTNNYTVTVASKSATLKINKINPTYTVPTNLKACVGSTLASVTLPTGFTWNDPTTTSVGAAGNNNFTVTYTPTDTTNYNVVDDIVVTIAVQEKYAIICDNNQSSDYSATQQGPVVTIKLNNVVVTEDYTLSYAYKLTSASTYTNGLPINAGEYNIKINCSGTNGYNADEVIVNFKIKKVKLTITSPNIALNYSSNVRTWAQVSSALQGNISCSGLLAGDETTFTIIGMHNGKYKYGTVSGSYVAPTSDTIFGSSYTNVIGSTYSVFVSQSNENYELDEYTILLKYRTALIGSTYYTIEDALAATGTITFAGDSTGAQTYVATTFSSLPTSITGYSNTYTVSGRTLIVPYEATVNAYTEKGGGALTGNVYTALIVPDFITITFTNSSKLTVAAEIGASGGGKSTATTIHGVIVNNGTINISSGCTVSSYGFIKGTGTLNLLSGSKIIESMCIFDWVGGSAASGLKGGVGIIGNAFVTNSYSLNNTSCYTIINSGATLNVYAMVYVSNNETGANADLVIPSNSSSDNYLFKPTTTSGKITKYCSGTQSLCSITSNNQSVNYNSIFEIEGSWIDGVVSIKVGYAMETGTTIPIPIGLMNIIIKSGSTLTISKTDFLFLPGSSLTIEEGATVNITNSNVDFSFTTNTQVTNLGGNRCFTSNTYSSNHTDSFLLCNGTFNCAGSVGGMIITNSENAVLNLTNKTKSTFAIMLSTDQPRFATGQNTQGKIHLFVDGQVNQIASNISAGTYYSIKDSNNNYGFYTTSGIITYNTNGGNNTYSPKNITIGSNGYIISASDLPTTNPTKNYYSFDGWYSNNNYTTQAIGLTIYSGIELYAKWIPVDYNIVYEDKYYENFTSGNTSTSTNPTTFNYETILQLSDPTNNDYTFGGWYINSSCTDRINSISGTNLVSYLNSNFVTIYALWYNTGTNRYVITFNNSNENVTCSETDSIVDLSSYTLPVMTTKDNDYTVPLYFGGWYKESTLIDSIDASLFTYNSSTGIYELTLDAHWLEKNELSVIVGTFGTLMTVYYVPGFSFTIPSLESKGIKLGSSGLVLINWQLDDGNAYNSGDPIVLENQSELTANIVTFVEVAIKTNDYTAINVTLTVNTGYMVSYDSSTGISTATAFAGQTKTNGDIFYITTNSSFKAKYTVKGGTGNGGSITGTTATTALTTADQTYTAATSSIEITPQGIEDSSCLVEGTLITMADGTKKKVEDIVAGDLLLVFNHETGEYDVSFVLFNDAEELANYTIINLEFSNGSIVKVVSEHGFFDLDLMKYVYITESNYNEFINHRFYAYGGEIVTLDNAYITVEETRVYSPVTAYHLNYFTEDLLSMPGGITGLFNIFEYDETLKYDEEKKANDIETYGLFTYEDFEDMIPEEIYEVFNGAYLKVAIAKGLVTFEQIAGYAERYEIYW